MTTITQLPLVNTSFLNNSDSTVYTVPTSTVAKIGRAVFCNTTASATTITAGTVNGGGALGASGTMISARNIAPGESYVSPELAGLVLSAGYALHVYAGASSAVTLTISGYTIV